MGFRYTRQDINTALHLPLLLLNRDLLRKHGSFSRWQHITLEMPITARQISGELFQPN
jgi:hypothetical protein